MVERWAHIIYTKYQEYVQLIQSRIPDPSRPLAALDPNTSFIIECDIRRGVHAFNKMVDSLQLSPELNADVILRAHRVFAVMNMSKNLSFTQGYDRYWFIAFAVCLDACSEFKLGAQFAEALSFHLTYSFLSLVRITKLLDHPNDTERYFQNMDIEMLKVAPRIMGPLQFNRQGSIHFALRWQLLLFADEYDIRPLLVLWDNIFHRPHNEFSEFLFSLCIAHIQQVPMAGQGEYMIAHIQTYRSWDVDRVVEDAINHMARKKNLPGPRRLVIVLVLLFIVIMCYLLKRHLK
jgi:hypothetical protein